MSNARRFRGLVRMSVAGAVGLSVLATSLLAVGLATGLVPSAIFGPREFIALAARGLVAGAAGGGLFAWLLARREHGQQLDRVSTRRVALWGALAAASLPTMAALAIDGPSIPIGILAAGSVGFGIGGAVLGAGLLRLARRAPDRLEAPDDDETRLLR